MRTKAVNLYRPTRKLKISSYLPITGESSEQALAASQQYFQETGPGVLAGDILVVERRYSVEVYRFTEDRVPVFLNTMPVDIAAMIQA